MERLLRDGGPSQLAVPLRFLFTGRVPVPAERAASQIENLRAQIAARPETFRFASFDHPLGPVRLAHSAAATQADLTCNQLANTLSVPRRWGLFLHLCAEAFGARTILELGACVGISGAYLASVPTRPTIVTLEGSPELAAIARETLTAVTETADVVVGTFAETLPTTVAQLQSTIDLAFVDGHHEEAATLRYVETIAPHMSSSGLFVLDDIYLYRGMWRAWQKLASNPRFTSVNVGRFGLLVCGSSKGRYDLARYTGYWRVGPARTFVTR
ncbi:MAG TPA: class I SAM-dependent methyltransferase [Thermoanaerobaculia bacterium]|nr:class I SAM-dependent methyltransferase [Thermoanaerobaculia bacterium]